MSNCFTSCKRLVYLYKQKRKDMIDSLEFNGLDIEVDFDIHLEEKEELEHQGCPEEMEITSIKSGGVDMMKFFCHLDLLEELEVIVYKRLND